VHAARSTKFGFSEDMAFSEQDSMQVPQLMHKSGSNESSASGRRFSGLWHHAQVSGQPLKNTTERMPGPSSSELPVMPVISGKGEGIDPSSIFQNGAGSAR
jgi:hypothetical protein